MSNIRIDNVPYFAGLFKALANPNRLRIFLRLASCCPPDTRCTTDDVPACVGDLGADLDLAPSTVSHHIKELNQGGLIEMRRAGQRIECWIPAERLALLADFFKQCRDGAADDALELASKSTNRR